MYFRVIDEVVLGAIVNQCAFGTPYFDDMFFQQDILKMATRNLEICSSDELEALWGGVKKV